MKNTVCIMHPHNPLIGTIRKSSHRKSNMIERITSMEDYRQLRESFAWECPAEFNFGFHVIDDWAEKNPNRIALWWVDEKNERKISFAEFSSHTNRVANGLSQLGLTKNAKILVLLPRIPEWWEAMVGIFKAGMIAIPGTVQLTPQDIAYRINAAEVSAIITDEETAEKLSQITEPIPSLKHRLLVSENQHAGWSSWNETVEQAESSPPVVTTKSDEPALIYFTSGTTGMPKMVLHTHASCSFAHRCTGYFWLNLKENDIHWNYSDTGWAKAAYSSLFGPWHCGSTIFVQRDAGKFQPQLVLDSLEKFPITSFCAPPTIYRVLVQQDLDAFHPHSLANCLAAGEPLNPEVIDVWKKKTGITIRDGYGQTETTLLCGNYSGVAIKAGSMGLPMPGFDLGVIDEKGNPVTKGEVGEIAVKVDPLRPIGLFREYWNHPEATKNTFRNGWYATGDCASMDEDGYFWFESRADDVISSSAYRIGPFEVESALLKHAAVVEAAVVGIPDSVRGQIVKAFVVLANGFQGSAELTTELQEHVKTTTAPYKYPREIEYLESLPKTVSGKIRRIELRGDA